MSLLPDPLFDVPEVTAKIAKAAFPKGNDYIRMRDEWGVFYDNGQFAEWGLTRIGYCWRIL